MHKDPLFQSLLLVNITIVGPDNQPIDFNKRWFNHRSPVFEQGGYEPPSARQNEDIKPSINLGTHLLKCLFARSSFKWNNNG